MYNLPEYRETSIMTIISERAKEKQQQQQAKDGYWQNELCSLGILEPKRKKKEDHLNSDKAELENLADIIKQAMFLDYKLAYSDYGFAHREEAQSTVTVG